MPRGRMRSDHFEIGPADLLVELYVRSATQTAPLRVLMKNAADEKRVVADVRAQQKRLLVCRAGQRDEHVRDILLSAIIVLIRHLQSVRARKSFEQRRHVVAQFAIADPALLQNVPGQNVKIKLRRYSEISAVV